MPRGRKGKAASTYFSTAVKDDAEHDDVEAIQAWLDEGNSPNAVHEIAGGCTCRMPLLAAACFSDSPGVARLLLERRADANAKSAEVGLTPLLAATTNNSPGILHMLLEAGAKDQKNSQGDTAEDYAMMLAAPPDGSEMCLGDPTCLNLLRTYKSGRRFEGVIGPTGGRVDCGHGGGRRGPAALANSASSQWSQVSGSQQQKDEIEVNAEYYY